MKDLIKIKDKYNIYKQIKNVNKNYKLYYSRLNSRYEIHDNSNHFCSLCLCISPENLNSSVIEKLYKSKRENMKKYFLEIEEQNRKLEEKNVNNIISRAGDLMLDIFEYSNHKNRDLSANDIKKIIHNLGD